MSKIIVSLSERDILDLELGGKLWVPVNPNLDYSNLKGVVVRKYNINTAKTTNRENNILFNERSEQLCRKK